MTREENLLAQLKRAEANMVRLYKDRDSRLAFERRKRRHLQAYLELTLERFENYLGTDASESQLMHEARGVLARSKKPYRARKR
jgi:hypothetical protein